MHGQEMDFFREGRMPGMPGRSGGHNRMSAEEHELRGTFKPSRHGGNDGCAHELG